MPALALAFTGQCTAHHGRLIPGAWELLERLEQQMAALDEQMRHATAPCAPQLEPLQSIPGLQAIPARDLTAELGTERRRLGSATRWSSWAGVSPGHNARAGKRRQGRPRQGKRSLRRVLVQCAWAARQTPTVFGRPFRRFERRLGRKQAAMAVAHNILVLLYHVLMDGTL